MTILARVLLGLLLASLLGCKVFLLPFTDVFPIPLRPDVPVEDLSEIKYREFTVDWSARVNREGIALQIQGAIIPPYVGKAYYLLFTATITNTRAHPIRLTRDDIAVSMDGEPPVTDSIDLFQIKLKQGEDRTVSTPTRSISEIAIDPNGTAFVDIRLRDDRIRAYRGFPQSATLHLDAFHDTKTGERIPFAIRFLRVVPDTAQAR